MYVFGFFTAVMPTRCVRKSYVFYTYVYTFARSCIHVYAHMSKTHTCKNVYTMFTHTLYHSCTRKQDLAQMYARIEAIMPTRICTRKRDHAHACMHT